MQPTEFKGGKGLKKIVGIAAMVAIPFVAPKIALSIGLSGSIGTVASSAVVGAGLGAVSAAVTGGDWKRGALMGGIAGGIGGYNQPTMTTPAHTSYQFGPGIDAIPPTVTPPPTSVSPAYTSSQFGGGDFFAAEAPLDYLGSGGFHAAEAPYTSHRFGGGDFLEPTTDSQLSSSLGTDNTAGVNTARVDTAGVDTSIVKKVVPPKTPKTPKTGWAGFKEGITEAYSPQNLGKASVQMAGNMAIDALTGSEYSAEQQELINQRKAEIARLEAQGAEVDAIKLAEARKLLHQAMQVDPTYLARQKANAAKNQASRATNEAVRIANASGNRAGLSDSIRRRGLLTGGKRAATAYDVGYQGGLKEKLALQKSGVDVLPTSAGLSGYYANLGTQYDSVEEARDAERKGYRDLFADTLV